MGGTEQNSLEKLAEEKKLHVEFNFQAGRFGADGNEITLSRLDVSMNGQGGNDKAFVGTRNRDGQEKIFEIKPSELTSLSQTLQKDPSVLDSIPADSYLQLFIAKERGQIDTQKFDKAISDYKQFASQGGLTASDMKAAADIYKELGVPAGAPLPPSTASMPEPRNDVPQVISPLASGPRP